MHRETGRQCAGILFGMAETDITPERPVRLEGQFFERIGSQVHDRLTATALAVESRPDGGSVEQLIWVSCDLVSLHAEVLERIRAEVARRLPDFDPEKFVLNTTHTHTAPVINPEGRMRMMYMPYFPADCVGGDVNNEDIMERDAYIAFLAQRVAQVATAAWEKRAPGRIGTSGEYVVTGHNRRAVYDDGQAQMYGSTHTYNFLHMEGPTDPRMELLYFWGADDRLAGVAINVACPSQIFELENFLSADYWHTVRAKLRQALGGQVCVLPLCGAAGDQTPVDLIEISREFAPALQEWAAQTHAVHRAFADEALAEELGGRIVDAVCRGLTAAKREARCKAEFAHRTFHSRLPLQTVTRTEIDEARADIGRYRSIVSPENKLGVEEMLPLFRAVGTLSRARLQERDSLYPVEWHAVRLGDTALVTNPFELYTEYGLRIKARSAAKHTMVVQLCCGSAGYLPTERAIGGGSYSGAVSSMTVGPKGGNLLVEDTVAQLNELFS